MPKEDLQPKKKSVRKILSGKTQETKAIFEGHKVVLAYLFGSQAKGIITPLSDVDVAVLFAKEVSPDQYSDRQVKLITEFMRIFSRNDVDIVVLNSAPPLMKHNVLKSQLLYNRSERERIQFEVKARREYFDSKKIRDIQNRALINRYLKEST